MNNDKPDLVAKRKSVVNVDSYYNSSRTAQNESKLSSQSYESAGNVNYFKFLYDKVRVVLGKNWDFRNEFGEASQFFKNSWVAPEIISNTPIELEYCQPTQVVTGAAGTYGQTNSVLRDKIVLSADVSWLNSPAGANKDGMLLYNWLFLMKTGVIAPSGVVYDPVIKTDRTFFDHYHESISPFTLAELENKQPAGKSLFASYKTYYNERMRSKQMDDLSSPDYENIVAAQTNLQNSLPSIYSFLRLFSNKHLLKNDLFQLEPILEYIGGYYNNKSSSKQKNIYRYLLKQYPLETLLTLYGALVMPDATFQTGDLSKVIEKIVTLNFDKFDANSLFSDYFHAYANTISGDEDLQYQSSPNTNKILALERIMSNLVFSPNSLKLINKVDQYKDYFPNYAEIEFTTNIYTSIGDAMKQLHLTKTFSEAILCADPTGTDWNTSWVDSVRTSNGFYEFIEQNQYEINDASGKLVATNFSEITPPQTSINRGFKVPEFMEKWISSEEQVGVNATGIYKNSQNNADSFDEKDLRNYFTYFRDDFSEPIEINDDENAIFKKLFGAAFYGKILETYNKHRRTYQDILDGKPAYTEDLFYRIEKTRKTDEEEEVVVQNILFPNNTELDLIKYVDTQLKYSNENSQNVVYKYNVYVHKIVFGSEYKYYWMNLDDTPMPDITMQHIDLSQENPIEQLVDLVQELGQGIGLDSKEMGSGPDPGDSQGPQGQGIIDPPGLNDLTNDPLSSPAPELNESELVHATVGVDVWPNIVLMSEKLFSTPDIIILDRPPVIPDVNIIPYRAINNRVKIHITGATDRYRAEPVIMLQEDIESFEKIKSAQLSFDNKVEFGSDDPVRNYQIFRTQTRPTKYSDFELYDQISEEFYEEVILPNTKYYYTFRAIDDHNHVSNPTPVYEVELIDEKGAVKPIIRLVDMTPQKNTTNIKDCRKYIYIRPTPRQIYFSDNPETDSIFSDDNTKKTYKMRLTSKSSGKKIDINFSFNKKIIETD